MQRCAAARSVPFTQCFAMAFQRRFQCTPCVAEGARTLCWRGGSQCGSNARAEIVVRYRLPVRDLGRQHHIDTDGTMRDIDLREMPVAQAMMGQARECWLATDVSKFNHAALAEFGQLQRIKRVFTEALPPAPFPAILQEAGVALTIAP